MSYLRQLWKGLWTLDGIWPLSLEFSVFLALLILPFVAFLLGWHMALETMQ